MAERETVISLEELTGLELRCTNCQSGSVFAHRKESANTKIREQGPVHCCPNCGENFDSLGIALSNWQQLMSVDAREKPSFRLKFHVSRSGDQGTFI
jgi:hypothetical protein